MSSSSSLEYDPPRVQIRTRDNLEGSFPTVRRMGPRAAVFSSSFNDVSTLIFTASDAISYPQSLPTFSQYVSATYYITGTGRTAKGVSDVDILRQRSTPGFGPFVEDGLFSLSDDPFFLTGSSDDRFSAKLKDKIAIRINVPTTEDAIFTRARSGYTALDPGGYLAGRNISGFSYYNFRLKKWEMIGLTDPETGGSYPFDWQVTTTADEQNISSGTQNYPSQFVPYHGVSPNWGGSYSPTGTLTAAESHEIGRRKAVGSPTVSNFAPFANKYHASSSQTLRMSDYINQPFLLEKVVVRLPIQAERRSDSSVFFSSSNYTVPQEDYVFFMYRQEQSFFPTSSEDLEGFGPLPTRSFIRRKAEWATGSMRYLVCSGVMTFYNNVVRYPLPAASSSGPQILTNYCPLNTPAFKYDWNVGTGSNPAGANVAVFTGSVTLHIPVAVASPFMSTDHRAYSANTSVKRGKVQHYWPGGTAALPFGPSNISGKQSSNSALLGKCQDGWVAQGALVGEPPFGKPTFTFYADDGGTSPDFNSAKRRLRIEKLDPRATKMLGGLNVASGNLQAQQSIESPYVLLPEDNIVFGIEAALSTLGLYESGSSNGIDYGAINNVTGSMMRVVPGEASVVLYGSTLREGQSYDGGRPQFLTSDSVSEIIGEDVHDQFFLTSRERLAGSLRDLTMTGSFHESTDGNTRKVFALDSTLARHVTTGSQVIPLDFILDNIPLPPSAAFDVTNDVHRNNSIVFSRRSQRFMKIATSHERFYDSITPSIERYLINAGASNTGSYISSSDTPSVTISESVLNGKIYKFTAGSNTFACLEKHRTNTVSTLDPHPYQSNPERPLVEKNIFLALSRSANNATTPYFEFLITNQDFMKLLFFTRGYVFHKFNNYERNLGATILPSYQHDLTGSTQTKYGIQSFLPIFSEQVYRVDKYGQFRDRLEQRKFGVFYDVQGISSNGKPNGQKGKKTGPVSVKFELNGRNAPASLSLLSGSSNRSLEATSSLPYIDGEYTNWGTVF